jgi:zinc protease
MKERKQSAVSSQQSAESGKRVERNAVARRLLALFCSLILLVTSSTYAQEKGAQSAGRQAATPPQSTSIQSVEAKQAALVKEFDVNGLKVLVKRREGSQTVSAGLYLRGGARNINAENAGIEALMLAAATEASVSFPRATMRSELSRMGTVIDSAVNYDFSALTLRSTRPNFDRSWEIFTDVALRPLFAREDVQLTQSRLVASLRDDTDSPDTYLQRLQERVAYAGHPYINRPQGTAETVGRLTVDDLRRYHQKMMQTSRLLLVIVGDLDAQQLQARIAASFGKLPRGDYRQESVPQLLFNAPSVDVTQRGLPTNYVQGLFAAPPLTSPDIYPMRIAAAILRERVNEEVRNKRNLSYAPFAFLGSQGANIGGIYVSAVDANYAVSLMLGEIVRLQQEQIGPEDVTGVVSQYLTGYYLDQETNSAQAAELARFELIGGGWRNSIDFLERLRAVKPADVQRVSKTYMRNIRFVVLGDPARVDKNVFTSQLGEQKRF